MSAALGVALVLVGALTACGTAPAFESRGAPEGTLTVATPREGLLVTAAEVDGVAVPLVLDLASAHAMTLTAEDAARVRARATGDTVRYWDATGAPLEAPVYRVETLRWAGVTWRGVRAPGARWSEGFAPPVRAGVLGLPLVRGLRVVLSVPDGVVRVLPSAPCPEDSAPIELDGGVIVRGELDGEAVDVLIDTAATGDIATTSARGGLHRLRLGGIDAGEVELTPLDLPEVPADVILGTPFLGQHRAVVIDLGSRCLFLEDAPDGEPERTLTQVAPGSP